MSQQFPDFTVHDTLPKLLAHNAAIHGSEVALREKEFGIWNEFTWSDYNDRVREMALGLISLGMMLTVRGEVNFHPIGFALVVTATLTRALKSIMQGVLLASADEKLDSTVLLYHMSWRSALWLGAWCVAMERGALSDEKLASGTLWAFILASSLVSFFLNVSQFLVTQATSAVTMQVLGNIKVVALILVSVAIYGNEVSLMAGCGCALCISGVVLYNVATRKPPPRLDARSV